MMIKKELVAKIEKKYNGNIEEMEETEFYMSMADFIEDWDYYNALSYCIAKAKNGYVGCYHIY